MLFLHGLFSEQNIINWHDNMAIVENVVVIEVYLYFDYLHFLQNRNVKIFPLILINI